MAGLSLTVCVMPCLAEIYKSVDEDGQVIYTDKPSQSTESVDMPQPNTVPAIQMKTRPKKEPKQQAQVNYQSIQITSPEDDSVVAHGPGDFTVVISTKPALKSGDQLQLLLDGKPHQKSSSGSFSVKNIDRGSHSLSARILSKGGNVLKSSAAITVHVLRPSVVSPGRS